MQCHLCPQEAVGRCFTCGALFCADHGREDCDRCAAAVAAGAPRPRRRNAQHSGSRATWWRPQVAENYSPPACYECQGLTRKSCRHCGNWYCADHAGPQELCASCGRSSNLGLFALAAIALALAGLIVAGFWL